MTDEGGQRNVRDNDTLENVDEKGPVPGTLLMVSLVLAFWLKSESGFLTGPRSASKRASPTGPRTPPPPPGRGNRPESAKEHSKSLLYPVLYWVTYPHLPSFSTVLPD